MAWDDIDNISWLKVPSVTDAFAKASQASESIGRNLVSGFRAGMDKREQDVLLPLKIQEQQKRMADLGLDIAAKQLANTNQLETRAGMVALADRLQTTRDWASPDAVNSVWSVIKDNPALGLTKEGQMAIAQAESMHRVASMADNRLKVAESRSAPGIQAAEYFNDLTTKAKEAFDAGDFEGAKDYEEQAKAVKDFNMKRSVGVAGGIGAVKPTSAMTNTDAMVAAKAEMDNAIKSGDADRIRTSTFKYNTLATATKMPGMTDASQRLQISSRTIPERIYSNATLAWDQVNSLLDNQGEQGAGPLAAGAALYQKTVGNVVPTEWGETAVANQSKYSQLRNSLQAMASADRSRSAALIKEIDVMMPPTGVWTSPAAAKTQLSQVREWVRDRARQAALDVGDLPPYWALTIEDAARAVDAGEKAVAQGVDPKSDLFKRKYMTIEEATRLFDKETAPRQQPPSNALIQLPNPPR